MAKKVAVISGASGAVGNALVARLKKEGFETVGLTRTDCDLSDPKAILKTIADIHARYGAIEVGIHAAWPHIVRKKLIETDTADIETQFGAGVRGGLVFLQALGRIMQAQKRGVLIGITSSALDEPYPGAMGAYIPAKYALRGILHTLKAELEPSGVRVCEIAPPFMRVGINKDLPPRLFELMEEKNGPLPTPEDVADAVLTLIHA